MIQLSNKEIIYSNNESGSWLLSLIVKPVVSFTIYGGARLIYGPSLAAQALRRYGPEFAGRGYATRLLPYILHGTRS